MLLSRQTANQVRAGSDASTPSGTNQNQVERSSVTVNKTQPTADIPLSAGNQNIESDPIVSASDKRIKHPLAQTYMQKLMLDSHINQGVSETGQQAQRLRE